MKLRFTRSEADPNHCLKVVDDRPLILAPYEDDFFLIGADPLSFAKIIVSWILDLEW